MSSRLEHRSTYPAPADVVYSTLVDEAFLTERLNAIGGKNAALLSHRREGDRAAFTLRQGVDGNRLPSAVRSILKGDLVVEREERWKAEDSADGGGYVSLGKVSISGVPAEIRSRGRLVDTGLTVQAEVRVSIPLIGGKIEKLVAEQVEKLLAAEAEFAEKWLAERG
jgi:hypothetical protein